MKTLNENCFNCEPCNNIQGRLNAVLINIADAQLYNTRFELNREVDYDLYELIIFYKGVLSNLCKGDNCDWCYGWNTEDILERARIISA